MCVIITMNQKILHKRRTHCVYLRSTLRIRKSVVFLSILKKNNSINSSESIWHAGWRNVLNVLKGTIESWQSGDSNMVVCVAAAYYTVMHLHENVNYWWLFITFPCLACMAEIWAAVQSHPGERHQRTAVGWGLQVVPEGKLRGYHANSPATCANFVRVVLLDVDKLLLHKVAIFANWSCHGYSDRHSRPLHNHLLSFLYSVTYWLCWFLCFAQLKCGNCGEVPDKWQYVTLAVRNKIN